MMHIRTMKDVYALVRSPLHFNQLPKTQISKLLLISMFALALSAPGAAFARSAKPIPAVVSVSLINARTNHAVSNFSPLVNGSSLVITKALSKGVKLRANTTSHPRTLVVRFKLVNQNGKVHIGRSSRYPYVFRNSSGSPDWRLSAGRYSLTVTPYIVRSGSARRGSAMALSFYVGTSSGGSGPGSPSNVTIDRSIPGLATWEANMKSYGRKHCENLKNGSITADAHLASTYYDAEWVFYQIGDYTGDSYWYNCSQLAEDVYRDQYVIPNGGKVPGYWDFTFGLTEDYLRTHDATSKNAVHMLATNAAFAPDTTPIANTVSADLSREVAYGIMAYLNDERVGNPHRARTEIFVGQALGHLNQWFVSQNAPYVRPFMFSLTAHALIAYQTQIGGNPAILPALKNGADWIWDHTWIPSKHAFEYTDRVVDSGGTDPAPDLNLLIAPIYAWLWNQTGETRFRDRADQIFQGGVDGAFLNNGKQFDQNYRLSFQYVLWRSMKPRG